MDLTMLLRRLSFWLFCGVLTVIAENDVNIAKENIRIFKRHATKIEIDKAKVCKVFGCLNGHCLESELKKFRIVCICYPGYEGKLCNRPSCPIPCSKNGACTNDNGVYRCKCKPGYTGASCNVTDSKTVVPEVDSQTSPSHLVQPVQAHIVKDGKPSTIIIDTLHSIISKPSSQAKRNKDGAASASDAWFSRSPSNLHFHSHAVVDRSVEPESCAPGFQCYHGHCDRDLLARGHFRCLCEDNYTGPFCDKICNLKCRNNGLCYADPHGHQFCMCPWGFTGALCQRKVKR